MKKVSSIKGSQGRWNVDVEYDDGTTEILVCAHNKHWRNGNHYFQPKSEYGDLWGKPKFQQMIDLLISKKRVVVSDSITVTPKRARDGGMTMKRLGYRGGVFSVDNIKINDMGISFDFVGTYAQKRSV